MEEARAFGALHQTRLEAEPDNYYCAKRARFLIRATVPEIGSSAPFTQASVMIAAHYHSSGIFRARNFDHNIVGEF